MTSPPEYPFNRIFRLNFQNFRLNWYAQVRISKLEFKLTCFARPDTLKRELRRRRRRRFSRFQLVRRVLNPSRANSDGATHAPLCSTTTLAGGGRFCATRNPDETAVAGAGSGFPLAEVADDAFEKKKCIFRRLVLLISSPPTESRSRRNCRARLRHFWSRKNCCRAASWWSTTARRSRRRNFPGGN